MVNNLDTSLFVQIILWTTANGISMISTWALIISIIRSPKCRKSPFNLYLVFSILPDAYKNTSGFAANLTNLILEGGSSLACKVIGWNDAYWWCANLWMALVVFGHLHEMLRSAKRAKRHEPPTISRILKESLAVHSFSIVLASVTLIPVTWIPAATTMTGCEAYPEKGNFGQTIFYWAFFMPITALIPTIWVTALCFDIWWKQLLPLNGKTRSLLLYFARLLSVIYIVSIAVILSFLFGGWVQAMAFVVFNLVGFLSVILGLMKNDVKKAWNQLWVCQPPENDDVVEPSNQTETLVENQCDQRTDFSFFSMESLRKSVLSFRRSNNDARSLRWQCNIQDRRDYPHVPSRGVNERSDAFNSIEIIKVDEYLDAHDGHTRSMCEY